MEYTVSERRTLVAFLWGTSWMGFGALLPWYAYLLQSWRALVASNACLSVLLVVILWWVDQSSPCSADIPHNGFAFMYRHFLDQAFRWVGRLTEKQRKKKTEELLRLDVCRMHSESREQLRGQG